MKNLLRIAIILALFPSFSSVLAQNLLKRCDNGSRIANFPVKTYFPPESGVVASESHSGKNSSLPLDELSTLVAVPNANWTGIQGLFDLQTNGRGLHNIQIDPNDPNKIHACVMTVTSTEAADSVGLLFPSRRVMYVYSSDAGVTWTKPVAISGSVRTGYPDMILCPRGSSYFPIVACHRYAPGSTTSFESAIFMDTSAVEGKGHFLEVDCDQNASDGGTKDLLWPVIALSKDSLTIYMVADFSNQANARIMDYMEFGTFTMNASRTSASWDGWKNQPGGNDGQKGYCQSGHHVIRTGADGRIGVVWINPDAGSGDHNTYFVESTDGGKTWPSSIPPLFPAVADVPNNRALVAENGLDFFYDGNTPHFLFGVVEEDYNLSDSNGVYYPYSAQLFYWDPNLGDVKCLNYNDSRAYIISSIQMNGSTTADSVNYLYQNPTFSVANNPILKTQGGIDFPHQGSLSYPTFARTLNSNFFGIFYEAISDNDTATVFDRDGNPFQEWYSGIYYQFTKDGGETWSEPKPFRVNVPGSGNSLDYRYPEAPSISTPDKGAPFKTMFAVDSLAGIFGGPGVDSQNGTSYSFTSWFYQAFVVNSVHNTELASASLGLAQNYPNPFTASTTIPLVMKNDDVVTLSVTDILGREIATVFHGRLPAGEHRIPFTAPNIGAGIYTYTLKTTTGSVSRTMSLVK